MILDNISVRTGFIATETVFTGFGIGVIAVRARYDGAYGLLGGVIGSQFRQWVP